VHAKGFTLLETLIGMAIVGIAFTGLFTLQLSCLRGINNSYRLTTAVILAQDKMETLKGLHRNHTDLADTNPANNGTLWQSVDEATSDHYEDTIATSREASHLLPPGSYNIYARSWNVADNAPFAGKKTVVVIVTWEAKGKRVAVSSVL
jgi:prepilin-type N-terminal cleavage/methylation domain-containing protein